MKLFCHSSKVINPGVHLRAGEQRRRRGCDSEAGARGSGGEAAMMDLANGHGRHSSRLRGESLPQHLVFEDPEEILRRSKQLLRPPKPKGGSSRSRLCSSSAAASADEGGRETPEAEDLIVSRPGSQPREQHAGADDLGDGRGSGSQQQQQQQQQGHLLPLPQLADQGHAAGRVPLCLVEGRSWPTVDRPAVHAPEGHADSQLALHASSGEGGTGKLPAITAAAAAAPAAAAETQPGGTRIEGAAGAGGVRVQDQPSGLSRLLNAAPTELQQASEQQQKQQQQEGGAAQGPSGCSSDPCTAQSVSNVPEARAQAKSQQVLDCLVEATEGWLLGPLEMLHAQVARAVVSNTFQADRVAALEAIEKSALGHIGAVMSHRDLATT
ncbi:hypothetical protein DUNSADRAFT_13123 [Dunaliella salina]|uniref:Encoded protein n=1 Tax=Dunaliella salina TaxID=3046 RepID=A0ABQ7GA15_DUNSA|nr:hypothetical protein DUNSADRAFT_13123 [Dunaliella salina]|eukprot:KAF5831448.1 hypothetical protein DUNSADRAFT_13123 [Dunaliella salina]